jgi:hypothetical protein
VIESKKRTVRSYFIPHFVDKKQLTQWFLHLGENFRLTDKTFFYRKGREDRKGCLDKRSAIFFALFAFFAVRYVLSVNQAKALNFRRRDQSSALRVVWS